MSRRCRGVSGGTEDSSERAAVLRRSKQQLGISNLAGGQQPAFDNDEVGEGKQRVQLGGVLGQAAVAQLAMAARPALRHGLILSLLLRLIQRSRSVRAPSLDGSTLTGFRLHDLGGAIHARLFNHRGSTFNDPRST
jgi:hypothetical protein